jgi:predicted small lipoprotein YifL
MRLTLIVSFLALAACGADGPPTTPGPKEISAVVVAEGVTS